MASIATLSTSAITIAVGGIIVSVAILSDENIVMMDNAKSAPADSMTENAPGRRSRPASSPMAFADGIPSKPARKDAATSLDGSIVDDLGVTCS